MVKKKDGYKTKTKIGAIVEDLVKLYKAKFGKDWKDHFSASVRTELSRYDEDAG